MRRLLPALLAFTMLAAPAVAFAHDPLDDVSGEEDFTQKHEQPRESRLAKREEAELGKELQERNDTEFNLTQEKEEFLRDRADTRDVLEAQRRRNQLSGGVARPHRSENGPHRVNVQPTDAPAPNAEPSDSPPRGDVDPTDPAQNDPSVVTATPVETDANGNPITHKKKHHKH